MFSEGNKTKDTNEICNKRQIFLHIKCHTSNSFILRKVRMKVLPSIIYHFWKPFFIFLSIVDTTLTEIWHKHCSEFNFLGLDLYKGTPIAFSVSFWSKFITLPFVRTSWRTLVLNRVTIRNKDSADTNLQYCMQGQLFQ